MSKWIRNLTLAGVFAVAAGGVATVSGPTALAQAQKDKAKPADPKKDDPKKPDDKKAVKGSIVIKPDAKDRFRISVRGEDGKTLLMSAGNGFATEKEAREAIDEIKGILASAKVTVEPKEKEKDK